MVVGLSRRSGGASRTPWEGKPYGIVYGLAHEVGGGGASAGGG